MATGFTLGALQAAIPYWYERLPYTLTLSSIAAGGDSPLFAVLGWTPATAPATLVGIRGLGATTWPNVQLRVAYDSQAERSDLITWPDNADEVPLRYDAVNSLSAQVVNVGTTATPSLYLTYTMTIWQMTVAYKVMRGYPLTPTEQSQAQALGLPVNPTEMRGDLPMALGTLIEREYASRQIDTPLAFAQPVAATAAQSPIKHVRARPNELLVLRALAVEAAPEDGVVLTVDRDNDPGHVQIDGGQCQWGKPIGCFVPALSHLTFKIQASSALAYEPLVRVTVWRLNLSNILRTRLGILTSRSLETLLGSEQASVFESQLDVGVY